MFLGLDLGTSGLRGVLIREDQSVVASAEAALEVAHPAPGWSEQDPAAWIVACRKVADALRAEDAAAFAALKGIAISGHMHGAVTLDDAGKVLRPCILWNDTRAHAEAAELDAMDDMRRLSGNIVFPGFTAPKLVWMARNEPRLFARVAKVLLPKDYLVHWLTGELTSEMSDAAGTAWLDTGARDWSAKLLDASGMRREQMPRLVEGSEAAGHLRADLAADWGISGKVVVAGGGGDNAAAACGVGALHEGDGFISLGTSGVLLAARDSFAPMPETAVHSFCHAIPGTWYQMGVILAATDSLNWLARVVNSDPATLAGALGEAAGGPGELRFLPYLSGERTPHNDAAVRGAFIGLDIGHDTADLTRAVMEGVAFALRDSAEALAATGAALDRLLAIGGGARSPYWASVLATVLDTPLDLPEAGEMGAALGAARLAICAATGANPTQVMTRPPVARTIEPRADLRAAYDEAYDRYRVTYPAVRAIQ